MALRVLDGGTWASIGFDSVRSAPMGFWRQDTSFVRTAHPLTGFAMGSAASDSGWHWVDHETAGQAEMYVGFRMYTPDDSIGLSGGAAPLLYIREAGPNENNVDHLRLEVHFGGELALFRGSTQIDFAPSKLTTETWHYVEFGCTIHDTTGAYEVRVDGQTVMSDTNVDTRNGGEAGVCNILWIYEEFTIRRYFADLYVCDGTGSANNDFLGDLHVETLVPNGDGNRNDFTPLSGLTNYEMVDDGDSLDADTSYVSGSTAGDDELYTFPNLSFSPNTIPGVQVRPWTKREDCGYRAISALARDSGGTEGNSTQVHPGGEIDLYRAPAFHIFEQNPNGPANWTESSVNGAEFGITIEN